MPKKSMRHRLPDVCGAITVIIDATIGFETGLSGSRRCHCHNSPTGVVMTVVTLRGSQSLAFKLVS